MAGEFELDEMKAIIDEFMIEANELISQLDADLVAIEKKPDDSDLLNRIFRAAHTIKGTSGFLGFDDLSSLTHKIEDVLNKLRKGVLKLSAEMMDTLLECVDYLKDMLQDISEQGKEVPRDLTAIKAKLEAVEKGVPAAKDNAPTLDSSANKPKAKKTTKKKSTKKRKTKTNKKTAESKESDADPPENIEENAVSEPVPAAAEEQIEQTAEEPQVAVAEDIKKTNMRKDFLEHRKADTTIRVDVERLDSVVNMVGELVLGRNALMQLNQQINKRWEGEPEIEKLNQTSIQINFISTELQMAVMKMRMLPIGNVFNKFPRLVRDLAREQKKLIDLEIKGEDTELDKSIIEEIGDPLVHLIRNSCDHGIEPPEERKKAGKNERGKIELIADQEGSNIVIIVKDDGSGLDLDAISAKVVEKGIAKPEEISVMSDREIMNFIFHPGFSTAKKVTDVSGRGVGMDVVKTNIEKLKGIIEIESTKGSGTAIIVKIPLTLAIIQGLLVKVDDDVFAIPIASVIETLRLEQKNISFINQQAVIRLRDTVLPIVDLNSTLYYNCHSNAVNRPYVVVIGFGEKRLGILVDGLLGQEEVVIKSMGDYLGNTAGIAGATIMGDGRIRLIIDIAGIFNLVKTS